MNRDWTDEEIEERLQEKAEDNPKNAVFKAEDFEKEYIDMLRADQRFLKKCVPSGKAIV